MEMDMSPSGAERRLQKPISVVGGDRSAAVAGGELDDLKFRIVRRGKCHYFRDVRFRDDEEGQNLIRFLEGNALEHLSPQILRNVFGTAAIAMPLQMLVRDLQRVFC
jgi:hypothetical protein